MHVQPGHPLLERAPLPVADWDLYEELWSTATLTEELTSILHYGFDIPVEGFDAERMAVQADRLRFYLTHADGHWMLPRAFSSAAERADPGRYEDTVWRGRQRLARKAFVMLCTRFFKHIERPEVRAVALHPAAIRALLWFFEPDLESSRYQIYNLGGGQEPMDLRYHEASAFLLEFCKLMLTDRWKKSDEAVNASIAALRPEAILMLIGLGKLTEVLGQRTYHIGLPEDCVRAVENSAFMIGPYERLAANPLVIMRRPVSAKEAVEQGTPAARQAALALMVLRGLGIAAPTCDYEISE